MEDYKMGHLVRELNTAAVKIAKQACDKINLKSPERHCFIAGAIGPTNKTLSMSRDVNHPDKRDITFNELRDAYREQVKKALIDAGSISITL
jgi:5-methyltetrahydrofolate--homocysteine methyltransferase